MIPTTFYDEHIEGIMLAFGIVFGSWALTLVGAAVLGGGAITCPHCGKRLLGYGKHRPAEFQALKFCTACGNDVQDFVGVVFRKN